MNNEIKNPQAFPNSGISPHGDGCGWYEDGMSLRDYMAAKALPAIVAKVPELGLTQGDYEHAAHQAYKLADAMLEERQKQKDEQ